MCEFVTNNKQKTFYCHPDCFSYRCCCCFGCRSPVCDTLFDLPLYLELAPEIDIHKLEPVIVTEFATSIVAAVFRKCEKVLLNLLTGKKYTTKYVINFKIDEDNL